MTEPLLFLHVMNESQVAVVGGYKVLSAKHITAGAGLDPLRAHKIEPEDESVTKSNPQIVSVSFLTKLCPHAILQPC